MTVYTREELTKQARAAIADCNRLPKHTHYGQPLRYIGWTIAVGTAGTHLRVQYAKGDVVDYLNITL